MRTRRRSFAAPFVVTIVGAAGSAGFTSCNPPHQPQEPIARNPPDPGPDPTTQQPTTEPTPEPAVDGERRWSIFKQGTDCYAMAKIECPKPATPGGPMPTCNPPPASKYACLDEVTLDHPVEIAQWPNDTTCHIVPQPIKCPEGAMCNPPPPKQVACPTP